MSRGYEELCSTKLFMASSGNFINFSALGTAKIGDTINKDNPGSNGTVFTMVSPSFACWAKTDSKPAFGVEPQIWAAFSYWNGTDWTNVYNGNQGRDTSVQFNVNYSFDTGNKTYYYNGAPTPIAFVARRLQGYGDRTHCKWIFMQPGHAGGAWYNKYMKGKPIYSLVNPTGIYEVGGTAVIPSIETIKTNLPVVARGTSITSGDTNSLVPQIKGY